MSGHAYTAAALPAHAKSAPARRSGPLGPLALAAGCVGAMALIWALAEFVPGVHYRDAVALRDFTQLSQAPFNGIANTLIHLLEPGLFILWGVALMAVALARERPRVAAAVAALLALAPLTSETLKPLLAHPHASIGGVYIAPASWPSGHSSAAMALALAAVMVAPVRFKAPVAFLGAVFACAVGVSLLMLAWHMPSDVLGGFLVASLWAALAVAAMRAAERRWPSASPGF